MAKRHEPSRTRTFHLESFSAEPIWSNCKPWQAHPCTDSLQATHPPHEARLNISAATSPFANGRAQTCVHCRPPGDESYTLTAGFPKMS